MCRSPSRRRRWRRLGLTEDGVEQRDAGEREQADVERALRQAGRVADLLADADVDNRRQRREGGLQPLGELVARRARCR